MRAANTAGSAAATQPAAKPRLKRAMKAHLVKLWHTVAAAGPEGTTVEALVQRLPDGCAKQISNALSYLRSVDYVSVDGRGPGSRWRVTGVPVGQQPPEWMRAAEMPRRPSSVFALAAAPVPADWTLKGRRTPPPAGAKLLDDDDDDDDQAEGVDIDAAHTRPKPGSTASELGWVAPPAAQCKSETLPLGLVESSSTTSADVLAHMAAAMGNATLSSISPAPPSTFTPPPPYGPTAPASEPAASSASPHFVLHSDGTFVIHDAADIHGRSLVAFLQPDTTRALFRWLDRLGGTHLSRTVEAA